MSLLCTTADQHRLLTMDASAIETLILPVATVALAGATVWLALEQRRGRMVAAHERIRVALRAALAEQLENGRRWHRCDPNRGDPALQSLRDAGPIFDITARLLSVVDLPSEFAAYLLWLMGDTRRAWDEIRGLLDRVAPADGSPRPVHPNNSSVRDDWDLILERLQVMACLLAAEASRRGYGVDAAIVDQVRWELPRVWPERMRAMTQVSESTYLEAPSFPSDPAYARCGVGPRDGKANELSAAAQASLASLVVGVPHGYGEV